MPILTRSSLCDDQRRLKGGLWGILWLGLILLSASACQPQHEQVPEAAVPPVGHYEGSLSTTGQAEARAALDVRHPSPGHYEAELTVAGTSTLGFVSDTIMFSNNQLRLIRPARPGQVLTLTLDGDFWRGTLALDSVKATAILLKRGAPTPSTHRVEEVPQANGSAWLFSPADTSTPGAALALLPDATTAPTAAIWADALAREGIITLLLPAADSATVITETPRLQAALRLLRSTAGADTTSLGAWATGSRATALVPALTGPGAPRLAFFIAQNTVVAPDSRTAFRELTNQKMPILGLYGGTATTAGAATLRRALGGRRGTLVRSYRATGADLLLPGPLSPQFGPSLPDEVVEWIRNR